MSLRWHQLIESDDDFLEAAPFRYVNSVDLPVPPEQTWAALTADETLVSWTPLVTGLRWTSPRPFSVGTTREVTILWMIAARERYYRWEEASRMTFAAVQTSVPALRRLAEDYVVEPTPMGSRLTWTLALEPHRKLSALLHLTSPITSRIIRGVAHGLRSQIG
jgi:uncharacterized protein YndB with AHSA1/START domain